MNGTNDLLQTIENMKSTVSGSLSKADSQEEIKFMLNDLANLDIISGIIAGGTQ